jgi:hypothetical protein
MEEQEAPNSTFLPLTQPQAFVLSNPHSCHHTTQGHIVMCTPQSEAATYIIFSRCRSAQEDTRLRGLLLSLIMFRDVAAYTGVIEAKISGRPVTGEVEMHYGLQSSSY